jgi:uncharacterized integral membrane protein
MRIVGWVAFVVAAVVLILFAVSNRAMVAVRLWPLPEWVEMPLYLVLMASLLVGFVVGELAAWAAGFQWRREARRSRARIATLEREVAAARPRIAP